MSIFCPLAPEEMPLWPQDFSQQRLVLPTPSISTIHKHEAVAPGVDEEIFASFAETDTHVTEDYLTGDSETKSKEATPCCVTDLGFMLSQLQDRHSPTAQRELDLFNGNFINDFDFSQQPSIEGIIQKDEWLGTFVQDSSTDVDTCTKDLARIQPAETGNQLDGFLTPQACFVPPMYPSSAPGRLALSTLRVIEKVKKQRGRPKGKKDSKKRAVKKSKSNILDFPEKI